MEKLHLKPGAECGQERPAALLACGTPLIHGSFPQAAPTAAHGAPGSSTQLK